MTTRTVRISCYQTIMTHRCACRMERRPGAGTGGMATLTVSTTGYTVGKGAWRYQGACCCIMTGRTGGGCMDFTTGLVWSSDRITRLAEARAVVMTGRGAG